MDVGLGVKGYAVIEQGKIGQILSSKPTDRRQLIEEAAGRHQVQVAPARQAELQARSGAAEPDAHRRHHLRTRKAARRVEAPGRQGAALSQAARRAAALGKGAVRDALRSARRGHLRARAKSWLRPANVEALAAARVGEVESDLERLRIELTEADQKANALREDAHQRELENGRRQQQIAFDKQQIESLETGARDDRDRAGTPRSAPRARSAGTGRAPRGRVESRWRAQQRAAGAVDRGAGARQPRSVRFPALEREVETSRGAVFRESQRARRRCVMRSSAPKKRATGSPTAWRGWMSRRTIFVSRPSG